MSEQAIKYLSDNRDQLLKKLHDFCLYQVSAPTVYIKMTLNRRRPIWNRT